MHSVDRGPEPARLKPIRRRLTPAWVRHYRMHQGNRPGDARWREFQLELSDAFFSLCGYCETECKGEVDHFRPKSREPELAYEWTNWVLACHTCNQAKAEKWPAGGYVDPCAKRAPERPESFFDFDTTTGEIKPKEDLSEGRRRRARRMIEDLNLNGYHHLKARTFHLSLLACALKDPSCQEVAALVARRGEKLSSISRQFLVEKRFSV